MDLYICILCVRVWCWWELCCAFIYLLTHSIDAYSSGASMKCLIPTFNWCSLMPYAIHLTHFNTFTLSFDFKWKLFNENRLNRNGLWGNRWKYEKHGHEKKCFWAGRFVQVRTYDESVWINIRWMARTQVRIKKCTTSRPTNRPSERTNEQQVERERVRETKESKRSVMKWNWSVNKAIIDISAQVLISALIPSEIDSPVVCFHSLSSNGVLFNLNVFWKPRNKIQNTTTTAATTKNRCPYTTNIIAITIIRVNNVDGLCLLI